MKFKGPAKFERRKVQTAPLRRGRSGLLIAVGVIAALMLLGSAGAYAYFRGDPKIAAVRAIDKEIADFGRRENPQPEDQYVIEALQATRREMIDSLSETQQDALRQPEDIRREQMMQRQEEQINKRLAEFFAMSKEDRLAELDKMIEDSEARRKEREERQAEWGGGGGPPGGNGGGGPGGAGRGDRGGRQGGGGRSPGSTTPEKRKQRERRRLDSSTPEYRGQRTEFVRLVQDRRKAMGLPPASNRSLFGMYRQLAPPSNPSGPGAAAAVSPPRS